MVEPIPTWFFHRYNKGAESHFLYYPGFLGINYNKPLAGGFNPIEKY